MAYDPIRLQKTMLDTSPDKLAAMSLETLRACHHFLTEQQAVLYNPKDLPIVTQRIELLGQEIELRRIEARSDQQHGQVIGLGRQTLFWAKVGGIAGVIATIVLLLHETPLSKLLLPSTTPLASPTSSPSLAPSQTPTEEESPSATPTPSLESSPASTPESRLF